ncbi:adenosylcobinamide-GDP ribazoletransferase [Rhizobium sp. CG5]|uniref:adenosylcobinamide-GDP ribazoletransferase n=1 Tax=Rhizobium sp. CG5 TaxID=2726076 RepID=UPI002034586A|nr:adenosylcobinamide-GDP ribazoletransferase [Rhizobium sp. CG5]MCM2472108.1 adenosylcobinamide-GDP ribazoletransferase [Rhizobium sp. CG5]
MDLREFYGDTARSLAFLSRLPVPGRFFTGQTGTMTRMVQGFPLAGALILLPVAVVLAIMLSLGATPLMATVAALSVQTLLTGALHEDGLGDTADGLGGGRDKDHALIIMKDSRVGSYGVVALILGFALRIAAIAALAQHLPPLAAAACLPAIAALSRALMVWHWASLPPARADGVASSLGSPQKSALHVALISAAVIAAITIIPAASVFALLITLAASAGAAVAFLGFVRRRIGGHTGDTIGACQQICEAVGLTALAMAA